MTETLSRFFNVRNAIAALLGASVVGWTANSRVTAERDLLQKQINEVRLEVREVRDSNRRILCFLDPQKRGTPECLR